MIHTLGILFALSCFLEPPSPPALELPRQVHAGRMVPGGRTTLDIPLANRGQRSVHILEIATDCGCTQVVLPTRILGPNQATTLRATLEAGPHIGPLEKKITLRTSDTLHPEQVVMLRALVKPYLAFQQPQAAFHGFSRSDVAQSLEIPFASERPLSPELHLGKASGWLSGFVILETPMKGTLCLDLEPSALPLDRSSGQETLVLATGLPEQPEARLDVLWMVQDDLVVQGDPITLSPAAPVGTLTVQALDGQPVLLSPDSNPPHLDILGDVQIPVARATLRLQWQGPWPATVETHHLQILTDRPSQPQLWIRVLVHP
ncbi:MAG: hypothetical protein BWY56_00392 [Acidobacteria bacterium ADurb.Bin340]|nr:MAG: hypothetical protein BWY56_00392 [Acidobacteria bacterium ADurb.Bin340]